MRYEFRIRKTHPTGGAASYEQVADNSTAEERRYRVKRLTEMGFSPVLQQREVGPWMDVEFP